MCSVHVSRGVPPIISLFLLHLLFFWPISGSTKTFCFDLRYKPNVENLKIYDFTVLDPAADVDLGLAHREGKKVLAYISVGEVAADAWYRREALRVVPVLKINPDWGSFIVDIRKPAWAKFVIGYLARIAAEKGYDGFFLDTVEVIYTLAKSDSDHAEAYFDRMAQLINGLKTAFPEKEIITNQGFEIYDRIKESINGFLVESLFQTYGDGFEPQDPDVTFWLNTNLGPIKQQGTPIYILDYSDDRDEALETARKIRDLGYNALVMEKLNGKVLASLSVEEFSTPPPSEPPVILRGPQSISVPAGRTVNFSVEASGTNLTYQWQWKGVNIQSANQPSLILNNVKAAWAGPYTVIVTNLGGTAASPSALLNIKKVRR